MSKQTFIASLVISGLGFAIIAGCRKADNPPGAASASARAASVAAPSGDPPLHVNGTPRPDIVENAWRGAGLAVDGFQPLQPAPHGAVYCEEGRVQNIDTLVCEYGDADSLTRGKASLLDQWGSEGGHTGVAYHTKTTMIGAIDRQGLDPNGKIIRRAIDVVRKL